MRISGGEWCGRPILMPKSDTVRPTQDRVREALFNLLQYVIGGARFLDLFAGSGAVGLDALSRGAKESTFIEQDKKTFATLLKNMDTFGVPNTQAVCAESLQWLQRPCVIPYDIVFVDPPYLVAQAPEFVPALAQLLQAKGILSIGGRLVLETNVRTDALPLEGYELLRDRKYGHTRLAVYKRIV